MNLWRRKRKSYVFFLGIVAAVEMIGAAASPPLPEPNVPEDPPSSNVTFVTLTTSGSAITGVGFTR